MFNCYQAVGMTCCTAGKGTREGEKASMHVSWNASYCGLSISCFADHKTIWIEFTCASLGFFEGICLFPFFKNNWSNVIEKKKPKSLSISLYWIKLQRAVQQFHSITLTNVHICQQWILHPQKLGFVFQTSILDSAAHEALLSPAFMELAGVLGGKQHEKTRRGAEAELTRTWLLRQ